VGEEPFGQLARVFWHAEPPLRGDLGTWGEVLPRFIEGDASLAEWPYLADCARLDWLVAQAERAADAEPELQTLAWLADTDPAALAFELMPGTVLLNSAHPVCSIWLAHHPSAEDEGQGTDAAFDQARVALAEGRAEHALVWRRGWRAQVQAIDTATARWTAAVLAGRSVSEALDAAGPGFDLGQWLGNAVQRSWLRRVHRSSVVVE
jgi:hypothetical protein